MNMSTMTQKIFRSRNPMTASRIPNPNLSSTTPRATSSRIPIISMTFIFGMGLFAKAKMRNKRAKAIALFGPFQRGGQRVKGAMREGRRRKEGGNAGRGRRKEDGNTGRMRCGKKLQERRRSGARRKRTGKE